jgi:hypothetical protein
MSQFSKLEVIDKDGWRNEFRLEKTIVHIGSDPRNDIVLERGRGGNVAPLHAQLILSASQGHLQSRLQAANWSTWAIRTFG